MYLFLVSTRVLYYLLTQHLNEYSSMLSYLLLHLAFLQPDVIFHFLEGVFPAVRAGSPVAVQLLPEQSGRQGQGSGGEEQQRRDQTKRSGWETAEAANQHSITSAESTRGKPLH